MPFLKVATTSDKKLNSVLYSIEAVGAVFVVLFLSAYLGGIPTTNVLQDQPAFRIPLQIFGAALLILVLIGAILAAKSRR
jgi:hypothetical protein